MNYIEILNYKIDCKKLDCLHWILWFFYWTILAVTGTMRLAGIILLDAFVLTLYVWYLSPEKEQWYGRINRLGE